MKILRYSAMVLSAAVAGCISGCGSGCGGTNVNANTTAPSIVCNPTPTDGSAPTVNVSGICQAVNGITTH